MNTVDFEYAAVKMKADTSERKKKTAHSSSNLDEAIFESAKKFRVNIFLNGYLNWKARHTQILSIMFIWEATTR